CPHDSGPGDGQPAQPTDLVALELAPVNPTITIVRPGVAPGPITFVATARRRDNMPRVIDSRAVRFSVDDHAIGLIDPMTGVFTAAGAGGVATVRAETTDGSMLSATTMVVVTTREIVLGPGVTSDDVDRLERTSVTTDVAASPTVDYPLEGAVMPRNVYPPH